MISSWSVYIIRCADDTLYTGIAIDVKARLEAHAQGKGAKYTKGRGPFTLIYKEKLSSKSEALKREAQIKGLSREEKIALAGR